MFTIISGDFCVDNLVKCTIYVTLVRCANGSAVPISESQSARASSNLTRNRIAGFGMALDMLVGKGGGDDGDLISLWIDRRWLESMSEAVLWRDDGLDF
jgi:hypothetical protein